MAFGDFTVTRASTKNILGSAGLYVSVANDTPAFEFNTDGSYRGLLVEPGATNLFERSQEFDNAFWTKSSLNTTGTPAWVNVAVAPDGTTTAEKLIPNTANSTHTLRRNIAITSGTVYTYSIFAKKDEYSRLRLARVTATGTIPAVGTYSINLNDGTVTGTPENSTVRVVEDVDGWYRCSITFTAIGTGSDDGIALYVVNDSDAITFEGDDTSGIFIWQAQFETGSVATSPIVTTAGTASRVADVVSLTGASSLIGQTGGGTLFVEVDWRQPAALSHLLGVSDGTDSNRIQIYVPISGASGQLNMFAVSNNVGITDQGQSIAGYTGIQKIAFRYAQNDAVLYRNGSSISADASFDISALATLTKVNIGSRHNDVNQANMWIRAVALFPTPLADAQLASITTP